MSKEVEELRKWANRIRDAYSLTEAEGLLEQLLHRSNLETLEKFRVFCYEKHAFEAWDTPQSNRQGWLDTKLRDFEKQLHKELDND